MRPVLAAALALLAASAAFAPASAKKRGISAEEARAIARTEALRYGTQGRVGDPLGSRTFEVGPQGRSTTRSGNGTMVTPNR